MCEEENLNNSNEKPKEESIVDKDYVKQLFSSCKKKPNQSKK